MDLTRPSSGHDQAEDPLKIHHPEEEEHHESRASKMFGKVKAKAKKLKNRLTKHGDDGNEHDHDVVDEEDDDESDETESEKHVPPVNEVPNVRDFRTSQPESLTHPGETNVPAPEEIIPSATKDSTDYTGRVEPEPLRDATYEHEAPSYSVRTSDVSDREESRETHHVPLNTPVSLLAGTEDETTPGEDGLLGGQREVNTDMPKRFEDDLSGESTYYHTQQGSEEAGEDDQKKSGLGTELASESGIKKDWPVTFGGESETELGKDLPTRSFESETGNDAPTVFGGKPETGPGDDFDQKVESRIGNDGGKLGTELNEDFQAKSQEFEQTIGSEIGEDNGAEKPGTERREDFLGKSYEFDQEIESAFGEDSPTRLPGDETRSDDMKVETGLGRDLPTETDDDHFSPEFSGPKERDDFDSQEVKPTTYSEMIGSATDETVADKLTPEDEIVKETVKPKLSFSGDGREADETEQGEDKFVPTRDHLEEKLTPEEEDKAFSDMVAEKLNLGGEKEEVAVEKIPSDKLPEEVKGGEAVEEEGKGGGIVGTIKGVYNYWLGGTEEVKPKSPNSVDESSQPLSSAVGTKGFSDSGESGAGETGTTTGAVAVQKQL